MNLNGNKITRLSDDIRQIFVTAFGEEEEMIRVCRDHSNPLLFHDKRPVLDISKDEFVGIFNLSSNHFFLSYPDVLRLGIYCRLGLPCVIALILKAQWESFIAEVSMFPASSGADLGGVLTNRDLISNYIKDFNPDRGKIFKAIRDTNSDSLNEITYGKVDFFIGDLLKTNKFLLENVQISHLYPAREITEEILLARTPRPKKEEYVQSKELWKHRSGELDQTLLNLERRKRINLGTENKYLRHFGGLEIEKMKYENKLRYYLLLLQMKLEKPELTIRELIRSTKKKLKDDEKKRKNLENRIRRSRNYIEDLIPKASLVEASNLYRNAYEAECTSLLRRLFRLLHSDTCPNYSDLSDSKQAEINELWLELMRSTKGELYSFSPSMLLYSYPDYQQLMSIYERACLILGKDPDCYDIGNRLEFMIRNGASVEDLLEYLRTETDQIGLHLANLELLQDEYTNEDQTQKYLKAMENVTLHTQKLEGEMTSLKSRVKETERDIHAQFKKILSADEKEQ